MTARADPRLAQVQWRDLVPLNRIEVAGELLISAPWLALSLAAAEGHFYPAALAASVHVFPDWAAPGPQRVSPRARPSRGATEAVMFVLSILMLGSMHAVQINHLRHHRDCLGPDDVEAMSARLPAWRAMLIGPWFPLRLHAKALAVATSRQRRWILAEVVANGVWIVAVFIVLRSRRWNTTCLRWRAASA